MPAEDLSGTVVNGRYRVARLLGEGAMGSVYLAYGLDHGNQPCALKMLKPQLTYDPKFERRFTDEARSLARLSHPNIVKMYEFFRAGSAYFIALAYVEGKSLRDLIDRRGAFAEEEALRIFKGVLAALDHGHQRGVIHRDVKPSNILIDHSGQAQLCDFGIAKQVAERGITVTGITLGTPEYMSPEQVQSPQLLDHRSDVYSAGIVLFEMLTGRVPFSAETADGEFKVMRQQVDRQPPDLRSILPGVSEELAHIVGKSLRKDAKRRYQGCAAFLAAIEDYAPDLRRQPPQTPPRPPPKPTSPPLPPQAGSRSYHEYVHPTLGVAAVKDGFCWPALFANVAWMFVKQLYWQAALWAAVYLVLLMLRPAAPEVLLIGVGLFLLLAPGFLGNGWRKAELTRQGFELKD
jgi:serine/threonine protein kinase